jgi:rubrerythrin
MLTLHPTKEQGATSKANEVMYVDPTATTTDEEISSQIVIEGLNSGFVADLLSGMLTHERCGTHLYRSVAGRSNNPLLKQKYEHFGEETARHVEILEQLISESGGNPNYVSPTARVVEGMNSKLLESTFMVNGAIDLMNQEMAMLDAVFLAESMDHANWSTLSKLTEKLPEGALRQRFTAAVDEVEAQEDEHLDWAKKTKLRIIAMQAESSLATTIGLKTEEVVAHIRGWLSS